MDTKDFMCHELSIHLHLFVYLIIIILLLNDIILLVFKNIISEYGIVSFRSVNQSFRCCLLRHESNITVCL